MHKEPQKRSRREHPHSIGLGFLGIARVFQALSLGMGTTSWLEGPRGRWMLTLTCGCRAHDSSVGPGPAALLPPQLQPAFQEGSLRPGAFHSIHPEEAVSYPEALGCRRRLRRPAPELLADHVGFGQVPAVGADPTPALLMEYLDPPGAGIGAVHQAEASEVGDARS